MPTNDPYKNSDSATAPIRRAVPVALTSDTDFGASIPRGLYVGTSGDIVCSLTGAPSDFVTYRNVPVGEFPHRLAIIRSTANGTTASDILALY